MPSKLQEALRRNRRSATEKHPTEDLFQCPQCKNIYDSAIAVLVHDCRYQAASSSQQQNASDVVLLISSSDEEIACQPAQILVDHFADNDIAPGIPSSSSHWGAAKKPRILTTPREHISTESDLKKKRLGHRRSKQ